jgi:pilus assembly protein CpaC
VLGNGKIRLEVRPRITERDPTLSVVIQGTSVPALTLREVDTAVEMQAGQTFALAGLVQMRTESRVRGLPWVSDLPVLGFPFRQTFDEVNEIELLIMVTPEFVGPMEPHEVNCCGPGMGTTSPRDCDLYCGGHVEVPAAANPIFGPTACGECGGPGACGGGGCGYGNGCSNGSCGVSGGNYGSNGGPADSIISDGMPMNGGTGYDDSYGPSPMPLPATGNPGDGDHGPAMQPNSVIIPPSGAEPLPEQSSSMSTSPSSKLVASQHASTPEYRSSPEYTVPRPYSPSRQPVFVRNATSPNNPNYETESTESSSAPGGLIGPIGYDAE